MELAVAGDLTALTEFDSASLRRRQIVWSDKNLSDTTDLIPAEGLDTEEGNQETPADQGMSSNYPPYTEEQHSPGRAALVVLWRTRPVRTTGCDSAPGRAIAVSTQRDRINNGNTGWEFWRLTRTADGELSWLGATRPGARSAIDRQ